MASSIPPIPDEYLCPITRDIMSNPVILIEDGCTYEESALQTWLQNHNTSPITNNILSNRTYTVNRALKSLISDYVSKQQTSSGGLNEELFGFNICGGHIRPDWKHQPKIKIKLTLLGASGVGKTVLGRSLQYGQWPKSMSFPTATIGPDILFYHLDQLFRNEYVVAIQLNDPPGQEKFEAVTDHFFKQCHGALLVSDTTNLESLIRIKQFWYPRLTKLGIDNLESVLVCTKTDLFEKKDKIYRDSFLQHAEEFAFAHQIPIVHVSAYRGDNVEHVFKQLISRILTNEALIKDLIAEARYPNDLNIRQNQTAFRLTSTPKQEQRKNKKLPCCK